jgi:hypothetical protein
MMIFGNLFARVEWEYVKLSRDNLDENAHCLA